MCGRYVRRGDKQKIAEWFHAEGMYAEFAMPDADYNVAPTTHQPIIRQSRETGEREIVLARWGLIPFFTKEIKDKKGLSTINARDLLRPFDVGEMEMREANPKVNNARNNGPEMLETFMVAAESGQLPV